MAVRGWVCAAYDVMPSDPNFLALSDEQLHWLQHAKRSYLKEIFDNVGTMLGTTMNAEQLYPNADGEKKQRASLLDKASVPLSVLLNGQTLKIYKSLVKPKGKANDLSNMNADDFKTLMQATAQDLHREALETLSSLHEEQ